MNILLSVESTYSARGVLRKSVVKSCEVGSAMKSIAKSYEVKSREEQYKAEGRFAQLIAVYSPQIRLLKFIIAPSCIRNFTLCLSTLGCSHRLCDYGTLHYVCQH